MTLENIMLDVTPPETCNVHQLRSENKQTWFISSGFKDVGVAYWMSEPDAKFFLRAAKNFAPLVKALEGVLEKCNETGSRRWLGASQEFCFARNVLAEALRKEP